MAIRKLSKKKKAKLVLKLLLISFALTLSFIFYNNATKTKTKYSASYNENGEADYKIYLKENNYYKEKYLEKNKIYIASLIDYVDIDFKYGLNISQLLNGKYNYDILATLIITEKNDTSKILYQNDEYLVLNKEIDINNKNSINILENVKINYDKYNNLVNSFKKDYLLSVSSSLVLTFNVHIDSQINSLEQSIVKDRNITMTIPLSEQTINIVTDSSEFDDNSQLVEFSTKELLNQIYYVLFIITLILGIILIFKTFKYYKKIKSQISKYDLALNKILKEYDRVIVNTTSVINIDNKELVEVEKFEELLDVSDRIEKPINYIELIKERKSYFFVIDSEILYRYILKAADFENEK